VALNTITHLDPCLLLLIIGLCYYIHVSMNPCGWQMEWNIWIPRLYVVWFGVLVFIVTFSHIQLNR